MEDLLDLQIPVQFYVDEKSPESYTGGVSSLESYQCVVESVEGHLVTKQVFDAIVDPMQFKGGMFYGGEDNYVAGVISPKAKSEDEPGTEKLVVENPIDVE